MAVQFPAASRRSAQPRVLHSVPQRRIAVPDDILRTLREVKFFSRWPQDLLSAVAAASTILDVLPGQEFVRHGQKLEGAYVIAEGEITIGVLNTDGRRYVRRYAGRNQVYGLLSMFDGQPIPQFYAARTPTRIIIVPKAAILAALEREPALWAGVVEWWSAIHRRLLSSLHEIAFDSLRVRVIRALLAYARQFGMNDLPSQAVELRLNQDELSQMIGMTRQSVSREVKRLEREGLIDVVYGGIVLKAPQELERVAESGRRDD